MNMRNRFAARFPRALVLLVCTGAACGSPVPAAVEPGAANDAQTRTPDPTAARRELEAAGIQPRGYLLREDVGRARAAGIDEETLRNLAEDLLAGCLELRERCPGALITDAGYDRPTAEVADTLLALLGELGTTDGIPLLLALDARGRHRAGSALTRLLERTWQDDTEASGTCSPPSEEDVAAAAGDLDGFVVLRFRDGRLEAEPPTADERADLAYFLAAVRRSGPAVGEVDPPARRGWTRPGEPDPERARLREAIEAAGLDGDPHALLDRSLEYLATLGYPEAVRGDAEDEYAWGGARYSFVMRDAARAAELLGELDVAADLYRRAVPGGGACGTSTSSRLQQQIQGLVRSEERRGNGCAVVAERLLVIDGALPDAGEPPEGRGYGLRELAAAGFDLERLYRGALPAIHRDAPPEEIRSAIERLDARGPEAWEYRVRAIEGLADTLQAAALPLLRDLARNALPDPRARAVAAIGQLARRPAYDPCGDRTFGEGWGSSEWSRPIRHLGRSCATLLPAETTAELAAEIGAYLDDPGRDVRRAAIEALESIASPTSRGPLAARAARLEACPVPDSDEEPPPDCVDADWEIASIERTLERIEELEANWAER
jgi:hypothetical protein